MCDDANIANESEAFDRPSRHYILVDFAETSLPLLLDAVSNAGKKLRSPQ